MNSLISMGSNLPEQTNIVMGIINISGNTINDYNINIDNINPNDKSIYDDFIGLIGFHASINLLNNPIEFDSTVITPNDIQLDIITIDYTSLEDSQKLIIDNFVQLLIRNIITI